MSAALMYSAAEGHDLRRVSHPGQRFEHVLDGADAEAPGRDEDGGHVGFEAVLRAHLQPVLGLGEDRVDGDAGGRHLRRGDAEPHEVLARLVQRHEVLLVVVAEPHGVHVEVGDDDGLAEVDAPLRLEPGDDLGGKEVRADGDVGPVLLKHPDERPRVELVEREAAALVLPGLVQVVVEPAEQLGRLVHQVDVGFGVEVPEELVGVLQRVDVLHFRGGAREPERALDGVGRAHVPRAGGGGEDQDFVERHKVTATVRK
jgi:hypothetical protein